jgi:hypothetical protein
VAVQRRKRQVILGPVVRERVIRRKDSEQGTAYGVFAQDAELRKEMFAFRPAMGVIPAVIAIDSRTRQRVMTAGAGMGVQFSTKLALI